jgi:hypothetical protein
MGAGFGRGKRKRKREEAARGRVPSKEVLTMTVRALLTTSSLLEERASTTFSVTPTRRNSCLLVAAHI